MQATLFYAWQADTPSSLNRYFILRALQNACASITEDSSNDWQVEIDMDTQATPGMCDVPRTILDKISECDIFVADLTFVGHGVHKDKKMPNSNVVFELGWAAKARGFESVVGVINACFGDVDGQFFDVKARSAIRYGLPPDTEKSTRNEIRRCLATDLERAIRIILEKHVIRVRAGAQEAALNQFTRLRDDFVQSLGSGALDDFNWLPAIVVSIIGSGPVPFEDLHHGARQLGYKVDVHSDRTIVVTSSVEYEVGQVTTSGILHYVSGAAYQNYCNAWKRGLIPAARYAPMSPPPLQVDHKSLDLCSIRLAHRALRDAAELRFPFPFLLSVSVVGVKGFSVSDTSSQKTQLQTVATSSPVRIMGRNRLGSPIDSAALIKPALDSLARNMGFVRSPIYTGDGEATAEACEYLKQ